MAEQLQQATGDNYVLTTGDSGAERLRLLDKVYGAATRQMLLDAGLRPGMRALDVVCGVGTVTCWMARQVSPGGSVVAVDISSDQLKVARATWAACEGLDEVEFLEASAYDTGLPAESFDLVHTRFLLCHLVRPEEAVREFYRLLKPGGVFVCYDLYLSGEFTVPPNKAYQRSWQLAHAIGEVIGVCYDSGLQLSRRAMEAGFQLPSVRMEAPLYLRGPEKRLWEHTFAEASPAIVRAGLATQQEIDELLTEMESFARDETVLIAQFPVVGVCAVK